MVVIFSPHPDPCAARIMQFNVFIFAQLGLFLRSRGASTDINPHSLFHVSVSLELINARPWLSMLHPWMPFDKSPGRHRQPLYDPLDVTVLQVDAELWILVLEHPPEVEHQSFVARRQNLTKHLFSSVPFGFLPCAGARHIEVVDQDVMWESFRTRMGAGWEVVIS